MRILDERDRVSLRQGIIACSREESFSRMEKGIWSSALA